MLGDLVPYAAIITGELTKSGAAVSGSTLEFGIDDGPYKGKLLVRNKTDNHGIAIATLQGDGVILSGKIKVDCTLFSHLWPVAADHQR